MANMKMNESPEMKGNRASGRVGEDSADSIRRAGGEDPRRYDAQIAIDRVVKDHDMSGYNHNATSSQPANGGRENEMYMSMKEREVARTPMQKSDGTEEMGPGRMGGHY